MGLGKLTKTIILIASTTFLLSTVTAQPALDLFGDLEMNDNDLVADGLTVWDGQNQELTDEALGELDSTNIDETENYDWTGTHTYQDLQMVDSGLITLGQKDSGIRLDGENSFIQLNNSGSSNPSIFFGDFEDFNSEETTYSIKREETDGNLEITGTGNSLTNIKTPVTTTENVFFEGKTDYDGRVRLSTGLEFEFGTANNNYRFRKDGSIFRFEIYDQNEGVTEIFNVEDTGNTLNVQDLSVSSGIDTDGDITSNGETIWDSTANNVPRSSLEEDSITLSTGNALTGGQTLQLGDSTTLDVDAEILAGNALEATGDELGVESNSIGDNELNNQADISVSSVTADNLIELEQNTDFTCGTEDTGKIIRDSDDNLQYCNDGTLQQLN